MFGAFVTFCLAFLSRHAAMTGLLATVAKFVTPSVVSVAMKATPFAVLLGSLVIGYFMGTTAERILLGLVVANEFVVLAILSGHLPSVAAPIPKA